MTFRLVRLLILSFAVLIGALASGHAGQSEDWNTPYDELFNEPDADVSSYLNERGLKERKLVIPGKTMIIQTRENEETSTLLMDISGFGAVLCGWMIFVETRAALAVGGDSQNPLAAKRLDVAISRINRFIAENSIEHRPIDELEKAYEARLEEIRREGSDGYILGALGDLVTRFENMSEEEFEQDIGNLLSVPRLPAENPCL